MLYKDEGFVIRVKDILNEDRIVDLFLKEHGLTACIAKGVKKLSSRKSGNLQIFTQNSFSLAPSKSLDIITEVKCLHNYPNAHEKYVFVLFYMSEVIGKMVNSGEAHEAIYSLLIEVLAVLDSYAGLSPEVILSYFVIHVLLYSGFLPDVSVCTVCGNRFEATDAFTLHTGAVAHKSCARGDQISLNSIKAIRFFRTASLASARKLRLLPRERSELFTVTTYMLESVTDTHMKSKIYIHS